MECMEISQAYKEGCYILEVTLTHEVDRWGTPLLADTTTTTGIVYYTHQYHSLGVVASSPPPPLNISARRYRTILPTQLRS